MSLKKLDEKIKNKDVSGLYLLYGEESFELNRYLEKIKHTFENLELGVNYFILDKTNIDSLEEICNVISFFGTSKLIVIKENGIKFDTEILDRVDKEDLCIIFIQTNVDKRTSEYKYLSKNAIVVEFKKLDEKEAVMYVISTLNKYKIKVSQQVAEYMIESCGTDKTTLINEFKKIVAYLEENSNLTRETIDSVCVKTLNAKVFDMLDLAINKNKDIAMLRLRELISQKESPIGISIMLFKQIKQMYMIKLMKEELKKNNRSVNIGEELGIAPFVYKKLSLASEKYTKEKLEEIIKEISNYEEGIKNGEMDQAQGLLRLVMIM